MNGKDPVKINENTIPRNILIKDAESRQRAGSSLIKNKYKIKIHILFVNIANLSIILHQFKCQ